MFMFCSIVSLIPVLHPVVLGVTLLSNISVKTYYLNNCQLFAGRDKACEVINLDSANDDGNFGIKVVPE